MLSLSYCSVSLLIMLVHFPYPPSAFLSLFLLYIFCQFLTSFTFFCDKRKKNYRVTQASERSQPARTVCAHKCTDIVPLFKLLSRRFFSSSQSNAERMKLASEQNLLVFQRMQSANTAHYDRITIWTKYCWDKQFLLFTYRMVKNPKKEMSFERQTSEYLHCRDEMQYKVLCSQTVSQESMCEEPKQLCSNW